MKITYMLLELLVIRAMDGPLTHKIDGVSNLFTNDHLRVFSPLIQNCFLYLTLLWWDYDVLS